MTVSGELVGHGASVAGWSDNAWSVWGKTHRDSGAWLPLVVHLEDTAAVAEHLWDTWLPPIVRRRISAALGGEDALGRALLTWLGATHDVAKAAPAFAVKARAVGMDHLLGAMARHGLTCGNVPRDEQYHHGVMGQLTVQEWLTERFGLERPLATSVAVVVGGHHGIPPTTGALQAIGPSGPRRTPSYGWGGQAWVDVRTEILDTMGRRFGVAEVVKAMTVHSPKGLPVTVQVDLSAALIVADWLASDDQRFPYAGLDDRTTRLAEALAAIDLPPPWRPAEVASGDIGDMFAARFPHLAGRSPRPAQLALARACLAIEDAPLLILEASMGGGKTEAAELAAEVLAAKFGAGGTFIALPTMATSDAMFARVLAWLRVLPGETDASVHLAHSKAGLNEDYAALVKASRARFNAVYDEDDDGRGAAPIVASWLQGRKRGVLADHVIGTIDQVLFGGLQTRHLALRHLALSGKVVVVDEVHAADDYMRAYLCTVLEWLGAYGTPVVLLSATLPPAQRRQLVAAYVGGRRGSRSAADVLVPDPTTYPCLTVATDEVRTIPIEETAAPVSVSLALIPDDLGVLVGRLQEELAEGGCVAVIRNTVGRAQATYEALHAVFGDDVVLVHSRFIGPDRMRLEASLRARLGPGDSGVERPHRLVVVGTQVLEQSLDIDVDLMVSDIAPADLILQRIGRLHRHQRRRPPCLSRPRLLITGMSWADRDQVPVFDPGCTSVYGAYRLLRAAHVLRPHLAGTPIVLPADIPRMVAAAYDDDVTPPPAMAEAWQVARRTHDHEVSESLGRAGTFRIKPVVDTKRLVDWLTTPVPAESDDMERQGRAQVRDTEDSLEVVLAYRGEDGLLHVMPGQHPYADAVLPIVLDPHDHGAPRAAAACTVRLPRSLSGPGLINRVIAELEDAPGIAGWQQNPWLCGQLVLALGPDLEAQLAGHLVRYDRRLGLIVQSQRNTKEVP